MKTFFIDCETTGTDPKKHSLIQIAGTIFNGSELVDEGVHRYCRPRLNFHHCWIFLGKPSGTEMARTEVTREITQYIRAHKLQDPSNGRIIRADTKLRKLLGLTKSIELTYFNLQKYMSPLFPKKTLPTTTTTTTTTA